MKIAFCSSEVVPFAKTGGLADVSGALPIALEKLGHEVIVILPRYKSVDKKKFNLKKLNNEVSTATIGVNVQVYFLENKEFFDRDGIYGDKNGDYPDNLERYQYYCSKSLEILKQLNIEVDIIHCNDWQTALIPVYLKTVLNKDDFYKKIKTVFTIHNLAYQGNFPKEEFSKLNLDKKLYSEKGLKFYDQVSFLKAGLIYSDVLTTVSKGYAQEIQTKDFGCGLEGVIKSRKEKVLGILNGLDYEYWNPETDPLIEKNYSKDQAGKKAENKRFLQEHFDFEVDSNIPLFGFVARLDYQKGIELIEEALDSLMKLNLQVIILGVGEEKYIMKLNKLVPIYPEKLGSHFDFDEKMAHRIYAGSDMFLMPSRYEPCGLSQMISMRYGTIPLVFKTGGLADTVTSIEEKDGNGFVFDVYDKGSFVKAVELAVDTFANKELFSKLIDKAFNFNFSWEHSARAYERAYDQCLALD